MVQQVAAHIKRSSIVHEVVFETWDDVVVIVDDDRTRVVSTGLGLFCNSEIT
jgi:hypothetical protein